jgi:hypothetical protein
VLRLNRFSTGASVAEVQRAGGSVPGAAESGGVQPGALVTSRSGTVYDARIKVVR